MGVGSRWASDGKRHRNAPNDDLQPRWRIAPQQHPQREPLYKTAALRHFEAGLRQLIYYNIWSQLLCRNVLHNGGEFGVRVGCRSAECV